MASPRLAVRVGGLPFKNPLIAGSGEHTAAASGVRALLAAGAAAVVVKSTNESEAARQQLSRADYVLVDSRWRPLPWNYAPAPDAQLFCRSGLSPLPFEAWLAMVAAEDARARDADAYVVPSLVLASTDDAVRAARRIEAAGLRLLELNVGAPHGEQAAPGSITLERRAEHVHTIVRAVRQAMGLPLWVKLAGQSDDVAALAAAAHTAGADAAVLMGRFMAFVPDIETRAPLLGTEAALGGPWALALTCHWLAATRRRLGPSAALVATNGARDGLDLVRFLLAGASAVEMTTAIFTGGARVVRDSLTELERYLVRTDMHASDLVGLAADRLAPYAAQESRPDHWRSFLAREFT